MLQLWQMQTTDILQTISANEVADLSDFPMMFIGTGLLKPLLYLTMQISSVHSRLPQYHPVNHLLELCWNPCV